MSRTHFWASGACWSPPASGAGFHKPGQAPRPARSARLGRRDTPLTVPATAAGRTHCACARSRGLEARLPYFWYTGASERHTQDPKPKRVETQKPKERGQVKQGAGLGRGLRNGAGLRQATGIVAWNPSRGPDLILSSKGVRWWGPLFSRGEEIGIMV